jgi:hypothetical protein
MKFLLKEAYMGAHFLSWALDEDGWSALRFGLFNFGDRASNTFWIGGWVGPRAEHFSSFAWNRVISQLVVTSELSKQAYYQQ